VKKGGKKPKKKPKKIINVCRSQKIYAHTKEICQSKLKDISRPTSSKLKMPNKIKTKINM